MLRVRLVAAATDRHWAPRSQDARAVVAHARLDVQAVPPPAQALQFESEPPGADVRTAQGQTCPTPCSLAVPLTGQAVTFAMNGYRAADRSGRVRQPPKRSCSSNPPPDLTPNPVVAALAGAAAASRPPRKRKPRPRTRPQDPGRSAAAGIDAGPTEPSIAAPQQRQPQDNRRSRRRRQQSASPFPPPPRRDNAGAVSGDARRLREIFWTIRALSGTIR